jgi:transposase InsO family protein
MDVNGAAEAPRKSCKFVRVAAGVSFPIKAAHRLLPRWMMCRGTPRHGLQASMSAKGTPHDNAVAENFFSNQKNELVHHVVFDSREHARAAIFDYIEVFYDRQRIHQTLDFVSPTEFQERLAVA